MFFECGVLPSGRTPFCFSAGAGASPQVRTLFLGRGQRPSMARQDRANGRLRAEERPTMKVLSERMRRRSLRRGGTPGEAMGRGKLANPYSGQDAELFQVLARLGGAGPQDAVNAEELGCSDVLLPVVEEDRIGRIDLECFKGLAVDLTMRLA